jgi:SAM-dependent methyltransferase
MQDSTSLGENFYTDQFYSNQVDYSIQSARIYAKIISELLAPCSVVDFGCGRGTWLKAFKEQGAQYLLGLDGPWNNQSKMVDPEIIFKEQDLNKEIRLENKKKFDLALSCEVAEHLEPCNSETFVKSITRHSDAVVFGAAYTKQGGQNHINERPHSFWAELFIKCGFQPFDIFRSVVYGNPKVCYWYQQNTFLYLREGTPLIQTLKDRGYSPLLNISFMNCVHPELFNRYVSISENNLVKRALKFDEKLSTHPRVLRVLKFLNMVLRRFLVPLGSDE